MLNELKVYFITKYKFEPHWILRMKNIIYSMNMKRSKEIIISGNLNHSFIEREREQI
jgi:hypothetical protein